MSLVQKFVIRLEIPRRRIQKRTIVIKGHKVIVTSVSDISLQTRYIRRRYQDYIRDFCSKQEVAELRQQLLVSTH